MKKFLFLIILFPSMLFSQAPDLMSYQTVVWDGGNNLITNSNVGFQISILQGTITGPSVYVETHTVMTNANGLASFEIGSGTVVSGDISTIDWSAGPYFLKSEADPNGGTAYSISGTNQLLTVPYAFYSEVAETVINDQVDDADADPTNEFNTSAALVGTDLNITDGGGTLTVDLSSFSGVGNPTDELNTSVALVGNSLEVTDAGGVLSADLSSLINDADADPSNELQTISMVGNVLTLSGGGGSVVVPVSNDDDPTNELQDLSFANDTVYISDGTETYIGPEALLTPTLNAPATNYGGQYGDAAYYKHNGRVYLQGLLNNCFTGNTLFVLPVGYRPANRVILTSYDPGGAARIDVLSTGEVIYQTGASGFWLNLDGLSFRAAN